MQGRWVYAGWSSCGQSHPLRAPAPCPDPGGVLVWSRACGSKEVPVAVHRRKCFVGACYPLLLSPHWLTSLSCRGRYCYLQMGNEHREAQQHIPSPRAETWIQAHLGRGLFSGPSPPSQAPQRISVIPGGWSQRKLEAPPWCLPAL